ncbi:MAG: S9 family peptidase, partial [FCB group bacterium]|nr:S9 family peptidase [FCB group bacterium]
MAKPRISIRDLYRFKLVSDPQISPSGSEVAFVVETMNRKDKTYYSHLYLKSIHDRTVRQLTFGKKNDLAPRWSPDGLKIAFISKREETGQIWILPMNGGEAYPLTTLPRGAVSSITWSPDGKQIAFLFHPAGKEVSFDQNGKPETPVYRHIKDIFFRLDGSGWRDSENTHVWVADTRSGKCRQLVTGPYDDAFPCWSPDGDEIAFISFREEDWQLRLEEQEIYTVRVNTGELNTWKTPKGPKEGLSWSPDGKQIAYLGHQQPYHSWGSIGYLLNIADRKGTHRTFGKQLDRTAYPLTLGDITPAFTVNSPVWSPDGQAVYYIISANGRQPIMKADLNRDSVEPVIPESEVAVTFTIHFPSNTGFYHGAFLERPDELVRFSLNNTNVRLFTRLNQRFVAGRDFYPAEEIRFQNGDQELQGWLVKPPDFDTSKKYPLILNIHGGPRCQYGRTFYHEMQVLAAAGYVVVYTNPRGSQGYGEAFADSITGRWGEPAMSDLMAAVDYVLSLGFTDKTRMGVTGGSYGGYMTNWIITHTDRFAAAVTQRSVSDLSSMFGNSDVGW